MKKSYSITKKFFAVFAVIAGLMTSVSAQAEFDVKTRCKHAFEVQCLNTKELVLGIGEITEPQDTVNYCQRKAQEGVLDQNCGIDECADRLDVLHVFKAAPSKGNRCVTQRW